MWCALLQATSQACQHDAMFTSIMREIVAQFRMDRAVLQDRGGLIIRQLCVCLGPNRVFLEMGKTPFLPASMGSFVSVQRALLLGNALASPSMQSMLKESLLAVMQSRRVSCACQCNGELHCAIIALWPASRSSESG